MTITDEIATWPEWTFNGRAGSPEVSEWQTILDDCRYRIAVYRNHQPQDSEKYRGTMYLDQIDLYMNRLTELNISSFESRQEETDLLNDLKTRLEIYALVGVL